MSCTLAQLNLKLDCKQPPLAAALHSPAVQMHETGCPKTCPQAVSPVHTAFPAARERAGAVCYLPLAMLILHNSRVAVIWMALQLQPRYLPLYRLPSQRRLLMDSMSSVKPNRASVTPHAAAAVWSVHELDKLLAALPLHLQAAPLLALAGAAPPRAFLLPPH